MSVKKFLVIWRQERNHDMGDCEFETFEEMKMIT